MNFSKLKLKLISSLIVLTIALPATAVYAKAPSMGSGLIKEQQNLTNKAEKQQYKIDITSKKNTIKQNEQTNKALRQTIIQKRATVKGLIQTIEKSKNQINSNDLSSIQSELQTINAEISSLEALNGNIKTYYQTIKTDISSKNYQDAEAQFDKIISVQNTRTTNLTNLNSDLDKLIGLLQTAQANSTSTTNSTSDSSSGVQ